MLKTDIASRLSELQRELAEVAPQELPGVLGKLEELKAAAWSRLGDAAANGAPSSQPDGSDELLNAREAARRLGLSADFLYRHSKRLPFTVRLGRRLRFSAHGIGRYIRLRQGKPDAS